MRSKKVHEILHFLEQRAPLGTAESWDNVGLLVGDPGWRTSGAIISIDLTEDAIRRARAKKARLILTHHPCIFPKSQGLPKVTSGLVFKALTEKIAVATYHTNFDRCALKVVERVSEGLRAVPKGRLLSSSSQLLTKLVYFVPNTHASIVRQAVFEAGAGHIGNYDSCSFGVIGEGTFRGGERTNPFLGKPGRLEKAQEIRVETVIPRGLEENVLRALKTAHPYEEVAFDFYHLSQLPAASGVVFGLGYGFWGDFPSSRPFPEVTKDVNRLFTTKGFRLTGLRRSKVRRIAFVAGKGDSFLDAAVQVDCDLLITGEVEYHSALSASRRGLAVAELGHRESERFFLLTMSEWVRSFGLKSEELNLPTQQIWLGGSK